MLDVTDEPAASPDGPPEEELTASILTRLDADVLEQLCAALGPRGVVGLESTCVSMRLALEPYWRAALIRSGFADQLRIEEGERTAVARRVVVLETRRRETFGPRLYAALARLGLDGRLPPLDHPSQTVCAKCYETELRLVQYRHGFVLDRRYSRALRQRSLTPHIDLRFHADMLPGHPTPSNDTAAMRVATGQAAARNATRAFPQRAAFLPLATWQRTRAAADTRVIAGGSRSRSSVSKPVKLAEALKNEGLDPASRPRLEELLEGRDIELCAFAPVLFESTWREVFSPPPPEEDHGVLAMEEADTVNDPWPTTEPQVFFDGAVLDRDAAPKRLSYPVEVCARLCGILSLRVP